MSRWVLSLDGKTLRGSRDGEVPGQQLLSADAPEAEAVLAQMRVDAKTNEHTAALELLGILPVKGKVVVGDAMFTQRDVTIAEDKCRVRSVSARQVLWPCGTPPYTCSPPSTRRVGPPPSATGTPVPRKLSIFFSLHDGTALPKGVPAAISG